MRRLASFSVMLSLFTPALVGLPVSAPQLLRPHPVAAHTQQLRLGTAPPVRLADGGQLLADLPARAVAGFSTLGGSWDRGSLAPGQAIEVRTRSRGTWSGWTPLEATDMSPDDGSTDARAAATHGRRDVAEPVYVGPSDGVQARVRSLPGARLAASPAGVELVLVDPGASAADSAPQGAVVAGAAAVAATAQPAVYTRAQWGADESLRSRNGVGCQTPSYGANVKVGFVHHTDSPNGYAAGDVPSILRGIYAYHVINNGWCDIGYNFLIDRFGRVWEGRYGGIDRPVIGAHTGGFNTDSFAASLIGTYTSLTPGTATLDAVRRLYAWKLSRNYANPLGLATLTSAGGSYTPYAAGVRHTFNVISGHRDAGYTTCPGDAAYAQLPGIRTAVKNTIAAGFVLPRLFSGAAGARVLSGLLVPVSWTLTVTGPSGSVVRRLTGAATSAVDLTWDWHDALGAPVPAGTYTLTLTGVHGSYTAVPWVGRLAVPGVTVLGASARPDDGTYLAQRLGSGPVSLRAIEDGLPTTAAVSLPPGSVGAPAVAARAVGSATVVSRDAAGSVLVTERAADGSFPAWTPLAGSITSRPAVAVGTGGRLDVVARGPAGSLLQRWSTQPGTWSSWVDLGGGLAGSAGPALAWTPGGQLVIAAVRSDHHIETRSWSPATGWAAWVDRGGLTSDDVAVAATSATEVLVAVRGTTGLTYVRSLGVGSSWGSVGGATYAGPAADVSAGSARLFVSGLNAVPYQNTRTASGWGGWRPVT